MESREKLIIQKMQYIFDTYKYDWMGCPITVKNPLTYHHIKEKCNGGNVTVSNGALLTKSSHKKLNMLKTLDKDLYDEWQWLFYAINESYHKPSIAYIEMMMELQESTDSLIYGEKSTTHYEKVRILAN